MQYFLIIINLLGTKQILLKKLKLILKITLNYNSVKLELITKISQFKKNEKYLKKVFKMKAIFSNAKLAHFCNSFNGI